MPGKNQRRSSQSNGMALWWKSIVVKMMVIMVVIVLHLNIYRAPVTAQTIQRSCDGAGVKSEFRITGDRFSKYTRNDAVGGTVGPSNAHKTEQFNRLSSMDSVTQSHKLQIFDCFMWIMDMLMKIKTSRQ